MKLMKYDIEKVFTYHKPNTEQIKKYARIRDEAKKLAYVIENNCPGSAERTVAFRSLEKAVMFANAI